MHKYFASHFYVNPYEMFLWDLTTVYKFLGENLVYAQVVSLLVINRRLRC